MSKASDPTDYDPEDYKAKGDADTIRQAEEIKSDPKRHQKAIAHLGRMKDSLVSAHANARRSLMKKTGKRLKETFGQDAGGHDEENE